MDTPAESGARDSHLQYHVPAYGAIDAGLGYVLFYVVVDRATPTVVDVVTDAHPDVAPSVVRFGLAAVLWIVLVLSVVDQLHRQLAALGVVTHDAVQPRPAFRAVPSRPLGATYLVLVVLSTVVAARTYDVGIDTAVVMIRVVATLDPSLVTTAEVVGMVAFFVSFATATHSLDRLVIDGLRAMRAD